MEEYRYNVSHLDLLKKYNFVRLLFLLLFCLVLLLQSIAWLVAWDKGVGISTSDKVVVTATLIACFSLIASQTFLYRKNVKIINQINEEGSAVTKRFKIKFSNKSSWAGGFVVLTYIVSVIFVILLGVLVFNFIDSYVNWGEIILKMPIMLFLAVTALNLSATLRYESLLEKSQG